LDLGVPYFYARKWKRLLYVTNQYGNVVVIPLPLAVLMFILSVKTFFFYKLLSNYAEKIGFW